MTIKLTLRKLILQLRKNLNKPEKDAVAHEIKQGINQAILYEQGKIEANVTVLRNGKEDV